MTTQRDLEKKAYDPAGPVLHKDPLRRLEALIRRYGGKPKLLTPGSKMKPPAVGKRTCKGQLSIDDATDGDSA